MPRNSDILVPATLLMMIPPGEGLAVQMSTILVIDDEPSNLEVVAAMLERRGHSVLPAATGEEAVRISMTHEGSIDLVVADVILRGPNAAAVARQIAPVRPGVPFLYISGTSLDALKGAVPQADIESGRSGFLAKPFTTDRLMAEVNKLLDRSAAAKRA